MTTEQVLVYTRLAADKVQPTKMDRPEDVEPNYVNGFIYVACTNNTARTAGPGRRAQPAPANKDGHVVEMMPAGGDHTGADFAWNLILICGDEASAGRYFGGWTGPVSPISCPDNVAFDSVGNLWVSTDGQPSAIAKNDGLFKVPVAGPERGRVQQFLAVPTGRRDLRTGDPRPRRLGLRRRPAPRARTAPGRPSSPSSPTTWPPPATPQPRRVRRPPPLGRAGHPPLTRSPDGTDGRAGPTLTR